MPSSLGWTASNGKTWSQGSAGPQDRELMAKRPGDTAKGTPCTKANGAGS